MNNIKTVYGARPNRLVLKSFDDGNIILVGYFSNIISIL